MSAALILTVLALLLAVASFVTTGPALAVAVILLAVVLLIGRPQGPPA